MSVSEWTADEARGGTTRVYSLTLVATGTIVAMSVSERMADRAQGGTTRVCSLTLVATGTIVAMSVSERMADRAQGGGTTWVYSLSLVATGFSSLPQSLL